MAKRYYWLKLQQDFLKDKRLKKLRRIPGGDSYAFIYLEMILSTLNSEGIIVYEGLEDNVAKEIALELDEDPDTVQVVVSFLLKTGLMEDLGDGRFLLPYVAENLGSEGASAKRVRDFRERHKALQCNTDVTDDTSKALQCNTDVTPEKRFCNVEKRREEKEIDYIKDIKSDEPTSSISKKKNKPFEKPTVEQLESYIKEKGYQLDAQEFFKYYEDRDWMCGKTPMKNWKNSLYAWNKNQSRWSKEKIQQPKPDKNSFMQNSYDFDQLEKELVRN